MGQKVNPNGLRVGIVKDWDCRWFDPSDSMASKIKEDYNIRSYIFTRLKRQNAGISKVVIERTIKHVMLYIFTARPGIVVGRNGEEIAMLSQEISKITNKEVKIDVIEIKKPEIDAQLIADSISMQLEGRITYKRALKQALQQAERGGCEGIKIQVGGRLGGIEIARTEQYKWGKIPLHTLRANIDYAGSTAFTVTGTVGVKVWVYKGESLIQKIDEIEEEEKRRIKDRRRSLRSRGRAGESGRESGHDRKRRIRARKKES